jgi:hypothetical protein
MKVKLSVTLDVDAEAWADLFLSPDDKDVRGDVIAYLVNTIDGQIEQASLPIKIARVG